MQELHIPGWIYYVKDGKRPTYDINKIGKWMYFYRNNEGFEFARNMCRLSIKSGITTESKVSDDKFQGVSCFYCESDDLKTHKKIIDFFLEHKMIRKTKAGKLYDISFKLDLQTDAGLYNKSFQPELKLSEFVDLYTGRWIR